ncbi:hypothetical protein H7169_01460 [Candidatus Gracilibacteria bacterium]|nr:hypothetical protein [Candidatus Gracilibacteria bacterium]
MIQKTYEDILKEFFQTEYIGEYTLANIQRACDYFGNPQDSLKSIHIAGTNGKGSVSKMIFQILKRSGKKVGVYTSPHNIDIRERFETQTGLISESDFVIYVTQIMEYDEKLSYYERCTLLAFLYFRHIGCEYAIMEVGMGGRLDATNIITPILSIITSISYDHMEFLGNTLEEIAGEKGGIIKPGIPVILYGSNPTLETMANNQMSPIFFPKERRVITNLLGEHQISNARIAYEAGVLLGMRTEIIEEALLEVNHPGRLQYLRPNILIDGAHNEGGMKKLHIYLEGQKGKWDDIVYCFNLKSGKHAHLVLNIFTEVDSWYIVNSSGFRICDAQGLSDEVEKLGKNASILTPEEVFMKANKYPYSLFVVFGSLYMMREFLEK